MRNNARPVEWLVAGLGSAVVRSGVLLTALLLAACVGSAPRHTPPDGAAIEVASQSLGQSPGQAIAQLADSLRGTPYRFGGATPGGFDCSGLVFFTHREIGLRVPRTARAQFAASALIDIRDLQPGDLVFFQLNGSTVDHVGIYAGKGRFIHAPRTGRTVDYDSLLDSYYADRFAGAGRAWQSLAAGSP